VEYRTAYRESAVVKNALQQRQYAKGSNTCGLVCSHGVAFVWMEGGFSSIQRVPLQKHRLCWGVPCVLCLRMQQLVNCGFCVGWHCCVHSQHNAPLGLSDIRRPYFWHVMADCHSCLHPYKVS
jgi:hypothetical protein